MRIGCHSRRTRAATRAAIALAVLAGLVPLVPSRAGAAGRALAVDPPGGLVDQVVSVRWSGFRPTTPGGLYSVTLYQCKANPISLRDCYTASKPPSGPNEGTGVADGQTNADGTGSAFIEVRPAQDLPALNCTSTNSCAVLAFENDGSRIPGGGLPATAVLAPLHFAGSPADCPAVPASDVRAEGSASTAAALYRWAAQICTGADALAVDYTELSSPAGRRDFLNGSVDVGLTSSPATAPELAEAPLHRSFSYAPVDVTGVVLAFNVSDTVTNQRITEMNLTARLVARVIADSGESLFQDPEFLQLNPGHNWPLQVQPPLVRAERNADALLLTDWLQADPAARRFLDGGDSVPVNDYWRGISYPTDSFEARDPRTIGKYNPRAGTVTNARRLFNFQPPGDGASVSSRTDGIFAVLDAVTARTFRFPVAKLRRASGSSTDAFVAPDGAGLAAGYAAMKVNADGVTRWADVTAPGAYPLTKADYAMVPTSGTSAATAAKIARFLDYEAGPGQSVLGDGYLPLPAAMRAEALKARDAVVAGGRTEAPIETPAASAPDTGTTDAVTDSGGSTDLSAPSAAGDTSIGPTANVPVARAAAAVGRSSVKRSPLARLLRAFTGSDGHLLLPALLALAILSAALGPYLLRRARRARRDLPEHASRPA